MPNKAIPKPTRPFFKRDATEAEPWVRALETYDRGIRRRERIFRLRTVRLDHQWVGFISWDHKLPFSRLNELASLNEF